MNINATLILQSIAMMIFVWFCMKFLWPPLLKAMDERRERIAEGLAASDRAEKELDAAKAEAGVQIREARDKAGEIVDQAHQRHTQILDQAKHDAVDERNRQVTAAEAEIAQAAIRISLGWDSKESDLDIFSTAWRDVLKHMESGEIEAA